MELKLPELGEGVHEGELLKWNVKPGDVVKDDQVLCEIMTDKATVELPSPVSGTVTEIVAQEGSTVKVGQVMLRFEGKGAAAGAAPAAEKAPAANEKAPEKSAEKSAAPAAPAATKAPAPAATKASASAAPAAPRMPLPGRAPNAPTSPASSDSEPMAAAAKVAPATNGGDTEVTLGGAITAAPAARRFARESGVDLAAVTGSGPNGRITREDIEKMVGGGGTGATSAGAARPATAAKASRPADGALEEIMPFRGLRKKIAEKMRQSKDHAAHFTYVEECDATNLVELRKQAKEIGAAQGIKVTYLPFVMKAMVAALKQFPIMNSELREESAEIVIKHYYNIALSVQTADGLSAPVVKDVGNKTILEIAREIEDLVAKARNKKLTMDDLTGGTITLTNAGSIGGLFATPIINYPEVSILGFNKIDRKAVVKKIDGKEQIVIRDWTLFSISLDHRIVDGAIAAEFMKVFIHYIENPTLLLLNSI